MFCSACGAEVSPDLNFCNRCGKELTGGIKQSATEIESFIWAIVGITIGGIGVIIGLMAVMKNVIGFDTDVIMIVTLLSFFMLVIADVAFITLLLKRSGALNKSKRNNTLKQAEIQKLVEMPAASSVRAALNESTLPPIVTEDTTRNLEPVMRKK
ncbi:MAG: zinc ribbon domain-containing protein [Pyrinomonadaceae bacterium]